MKKQTSAILLLLAIAVLLCGIAAYAVYFSPESDQMETSVVSAGGGKILGTSVQKKPTDTVSSQTVATVKISESEEQPAPSAPQPPSVAGSRDQTVATVRVIRAE